MENTVHTKISLNTNWATIKFMDKYTITKLKTSGCIHNNKLIRTGDECGYM